MNSIKMSLQLQPPFKHHKMQQLVFYVLLVIYYNDKIFACYALQTIRYRSATSADVTIAKKILFQQAMNPLSIQAGNMIVADIVTGGDNSYIDNFDDCKTFNVVGFGQIRPLSSTADLDDSFFELASLYVDPSYRRKGIATQIIQQLLERIDSSNNNHGRNICCLLTLKPTAPLYEHHGFQMVNNTLTLPRQIQMEAVAGSIISNILGNDLVCMTRVKS